MNELIVLAVHVIFIGISIKYGIDCIGIWRIIFIIAGFSHLMSIICIICSLITHQ